MPKDADRGAVPSFGVPRPQPRGLAVPKIMPQEPQWLRANVTGRPEATDRAAKVLRGFVVAQAGTFKDRRGAFDKEALSMIAAQGNAAPKGLKSRFGHPTLSDDGIGKFLGRAVGFRLGKALDARSGKPVDAVRADLHFDATAHDTPHGDLADYVMRLAESDPDAISASLVIEPDEVEQLDAKGRPLKDDDGEPLPAIWRPKRLHAIDVVDTGDAVDALLSPEQLTQALSVGLTPELAGVLRFDNVARLASQMLDGLFAGQGEAVIRARCEAWLARYLSHRFGEAGPTPDLDARRERMDRLTVALRRRGLTT
jgi:hypothetical protein